MYKTGILLKDGNIKDYNGNLYKLSLIVENDIPKSFFDAKDVGGDGSFYRQSIEPFIGMRFGFEYNGVNYAYNFKVLKPMKVSFDFDGTLSKKETQKYAKFLKDNGIDVHITTSRFTDPHAYSLLSNHNDIWRCIYDLNIDKNKVHFTDMNLKYHYLSDNNFIWHVDDNYEEILTINDNTSVKCFFVNDKNWMEEANKLLLIS